MPATGNEVRRAPFAIVIWLFVLLIAFYLFAWPPVEGLIAVSTWTKLPCYAPPKPAAGQFYFEFNGKRYYSPRLNLWMVHQMDPVVAAQDTMLPISNATCYVKADSAGGAAVAVLDPTAGPGWPLLLDRMSILLLAVIAVGVLHFQIRRAARSAKAANPPVAPT